MKSLSGKELCRILKENGWILKNVHGSHHVYMKPGKPERISIPVHGNKDLKTGLLNSILKIADVPEDEI
jgi:predicted RNA binding protein YcfA (HicA-like mRNA interferase family)